MKDFFGKHRSKLIALCCAVLLIAALFYVTGAFA